MGGFSNELPGDVSIISGVWFAQLARLLAAWTCFIFCHSCLLFLVFSLLFFLGGGGRKKTRSNFKMAKDIVRFVSPFATAASERLHTRMTMSGRHLSESSQSKGEPS